MKVFNFKHFQVQQNHSALKVGTDAMVLGASVEALNPKKILDIGTGTGVLALMIAQKFRESEILGIDNDSDSLKDCAVNFQYSPWSNRLNFQEISIFDFKSESKYDLIVSNPPFYENGLISMDERNTNAKHTADFSIEKLFKIVKNLLSPCGDFWIILDAINHEKWIAINEGNQFYCHKHIRIFGNSENFNRSILVFSTVQKLYQQSDLVIRTQKGKYTEQYKELTHAFHDRILD